MKVTTHDIIATYGTDGFWAILRGQMDVGLEPAEIDSLAQEMGRELQAEQEYEELNADLLEFGSQFNDPWAYEVDEAACFDLFMAISEGAIYADFEADFAHFLAQIKADYAHSTQDFASFLVDLYDEWVPPTPKTTYQDLDLLWDQIAAAHAKVAPEPLFNTPQLVQINEKGWFKWEGQSPKITDNYGQAMIYNVYAPSPMSH